MADDSKLHEERRQRMFQLEADVQEVKQAQNSHEAVCAERYTHINKSITTLNDDMKVIFTRLWKTGIGIILLLLSIAGYLYVENAHLHDIVIVEQSK